MNGMKALGAGGEGRLFPHPCLPMAFLPAQSAKRPGRWMWVVLLAQQRLLWPSRHRSRGQDQTQGLS